MTSKHLVTDQPEFRAYEAEAMRGANGVTIWMRLCEEFDTESGRWESFYSLVR